jgi:hypothetical protein
MIPFVPLPRVTLRVMFSDFDTETSFFIIDLDDRFDMILGMRWLEAHQPWINWRSKTIGRTTPIPEAKYFGSVESPAGSTPTARVVGEEVFVAANAGTGVPTDHTVPHIYGRALTASVRGTEAFVADPARTGVPIAHTVPCQLVPALTASVSGNETCVAAVPTLTASVSGIEACQAVDSTLTSSVSGTGAFVATPAGHSVPSTHTKPRKYVSFADDLVVSASSTDHVVSDHNQASRFFAEDLVLVGVISRRLVRSSHLHHSPRCRKMNFSTRFVHVSCVH